MAFCLSMPGVPYVKTYSDALALLERASKPRGYAADMRIPRGTHRANDSTGVSKDPEGNITFRYCSFKLVMWHPDGTCAVNNGNYFSSSTVVFLRRFTPERINFWNGATLLVTGYDFRRKVYNLNGAKAHLSADGELLNPQDLRPFAREFVDRKKAKALLEQRGFYKFAAWYKIMRPLVESHVHSEIFWKIEGDLDLHNDENWPKLLQSRYFNGKPTRAWDAITRRNVQTTAGAPTTEGFLAKLRNAIYADAEHTDDYPYYGVEKPFLTSDDNTNAWKPA